MIMDTTLKRNAIRRLRAVSLVILTGCTLFLAACETLDSSGLSGVLAAAAAGGGRPLTTDTVIAGLKEALRVGAQQTVSRTSSEGGYSDNPAIRIPMPEKLQAMSRTLRSVGLGAQVDRFESRMNAAAERAAAEALPVFVDAVKGMSFADARRILRGGDTAATDYFRGQTFDTLAQRYTPLVREKMTELEVVQLFETLQSRYNNIPLVPDSTYRIEDYVVEEALSGLFTVLGEEEKKIRENPAARTTALLRRVFGS